MAPDHFLNKSKKLASDMLLLVGMNNSVSLANKEAIKKLLATNYLQAKQLADAKELIAKLFAGDRKFEDLVLEYESEDGLDEAVAVESDRGSEIDEKSLFGELESNFGGEAELTRNVSDRALQVKKRMAVVQFLGDAIREEPHDNLAAIDVLEREASDHFLQAAEGEKSAFSISVKELTEGATSQLAGKRSAASVNCDASEGPGLGLESTKATMATMGSTNDTCLQKSILELADAAGEAGTTTVRDFFMNNLETAVPGWFLQYTDLSFFGELGFKNLVSALTESDEVWMGEIVGECRPVVSDRCPLTASSRSLFSQSLRVCAFRPCAKRGGRGDRVFSCKRPRRECELSHNPPQNVLRAVAVLCASLGLFCGLRGRTKTDSSIALVGTCCDLKIGKLRKRRDNCKGRVLACEDCRDKLGQAYWFARERPHLGEIRNSQLAAAEASARSDQGLWAWGSPKEGARLAGSIRE